MSTMTFVLKHVQIPDDTPIDLFCRADVSGEDTVSLFSSLSPQLCHQGSVGSPGPFEALRISIKHDGFGVEGWRSTPNELDSDRMSTSFSSHNGKSIIDLSPDDLGEMVLSYFFRTIDMAGLKILLVELRMNCDYGSTGHVWKGVFPKLRDLQTLYIAEGAADDAVQELLDTLLLKSSGTAGNFTNQAPSPQALLERSSQLTFLILKDVKFRNRAGTPSYDDAYSTFLRVCRARRGGIGLRSLSIFSGINIDQAEVQALGRVVTEAVWDRSVRCEEPDDSGREGGGEGKPYHDWETRMDTYYGDDDYDDYESDYGMGWY